MSIRVRVVDGCTIAVCAARSVPKPGDLYLDDAVHRALSIKFDLDFASMNFLARPPVYAESEEARLMEREESNNANRTAWEYVYGTGAGTAEREA